MFRQLIEKAEEQLVKKAPFVLYRKPSSTIVNGGFQNTPEVYHVKTFKEKGFVFAPFNAELPVVLMHLDDHVMAPYVPLLKEEEHKRTECNIEESDKDFHIQLVKKGIAEIKKDAFKKVVLSRKIVVDCTRDPFILFTALLQKYSAAFCYLWYHPKIGMWLGATPEILMRLEGKRLTTMSLAGTKPYVEEQEAQWGAKELEEQELVTEYITTALKDKVDKLVSSKVASIRAGNLWHLRTKLTADIKNESLQSIVKVLHPTPAVCGMPKEVTQSFILKEENYDRLFYTGYLGELNVKQENLRTTRRRNTENRAYKSIKIVSDLYVNLRCMQLIKEKAFVYVGGGITKDSDPEKEWEETVNKSKTMLSILGAT
ncbi:chorismate-binding protein [Maribacter sp.]|uniref:chorismate-binding protein n=1 Tax=Maribacter sp. TaxID=1897614 RepID=UPI0025C46843|nr:chorismate-binding protein [Maribacter sp.]